MKPWIALIIGIIIGWLIGWFVEMWLRRRRTAESAPLRAAVVSPNGEIELPPPSTPEPAAVAQPIDLREAEHEAPPDVDWGALRAAVAAQEVAPAPPIDREASLYAPHAEPPQAETPSLGAELPEEPSAAGALPEDALPALEPSAAEAPTEDDLLIIEGIGPVYAGKLNAAGITTYAQLAAETPESLDAIIQAPSWRKMYFAEWLEQAQLLRDNDEERLRELQARLFRRKKEQ